MIFHSIRPAWASLAAACLSAILTGCTFLGPQSIRAGRSDYNVAIRQTSDQQLLLNIVRLRYHDVPYFLEIGSVTAQYRLSPEASLDAVITPDSPGTDLTRLGPRLRFAYEEKPTITYRPLNGEDFVKQLLTPVEMDTLLLLANSGWGAERLLHLTVSRINRLSNAAVPGSSTEPDAKFLRIAELLAAFQTGDTLHIGYRQEDGRPVPTLRFASHAVGSPQYQEFVHLLDLTPGLREYRLRLARGAGLGNGDTIRIVTRSLYGILNYVSNGVAVPAADLSAGKVIALANTVDRSAEKLLRIGFSATRPSDAAVAIRYRDYWFYIDDTHLESKATVALLAQLFALQSGVRERSRGPILTLPLG